MSALKFREVPREPLTVEAQRVPKSKAPDDFADICQWCGGRTSSRYVQYLRVVIYANDHCREMFADPGDWIVKHPYGEFEVFSPSAFKRSFVPLEDCQ